MLIIVAIMIIIVTTIATIKIIVMMLNARVAAVGGSKSHPLLSDASGSFESDDLCIVNTSQFDNKTYYM